MDLRKYYIDQLIDMRAETRSKKDWETSDRIRKYLDRKRVIIFDTPDGQVTIRVPPGPLTRKNRNPKTKRMGLRKYIEHLEKENINQEKRIALWVYNNLPQGKSEYGGPREYTQQWMRTMYKPFDILKKI